MVAIVSWLLHLGVAIDPISESRALILIVFLVCVFVAVALRSGEQLVDTFILLDVDSHVGFVHRLDTTNGSASIDQNL